MQAKCCQRNCFAFCITDRATTDQLSIAYNYIDIFTKVSKACIGSIFVQFIIQVVVVQDCCCYDYDISTNYLVAYEIQWLHFCCQRIGINYTPTGYIIAECIFLPTTYILESAMRIF